MNKCKFLTPCGICEIKSIQSGIPYECDLKRIGKLEEEQKMPIPKFVEDKTYTDKGGTDCMDEDAKQASIPYTYNAPEHDWKCGYPKDNGRYER